MGYAIVNPKRHEQIAVAETLEEAKQKAEELSPEQDSLLWVMDQADYFTNREMGRIIYRGGMQPAPDWGMDR